MEEKQVNTDSQIIIQRLNHLTQIITLYSDTSKRELDNVSKHLEKIDATIEQLNKQVTVQNGRVNRLEIFKENCPGPSIRASIGKLRSELGAVYVLSANFKVVLLTIIGVSLLMKLFGIAFDKILNYITI